MTRLPSALVLALLLPTSLLAQVPAQPADSVAERPIPLETLVVTATKDPVRAGRVGFAFSVLTAGRLRSEHVTTAADALRLVPGAFMDEAAGPGGPTVVRLRGGEEVFTQILMDGVQVNAPGGFFDMRGLSLGHLSRVEVARGPQSAVHGSSAMSGVINLLTPPGELGKPQVRLLGEGGEATQNGGSWFGQGTVAGGGERLRYSAGFTAAYERGVYDLPHDLKTRDGVVRLDFVPSRSFELTGIARLVTVASKLPVRDAGAERVPLDPNAKDDRDRRIATLSARFQPTARWTNRARLSRYDEDFHYEDTSDGVQLPPNADFFVFDATYQFRSQVARSTAEYGGTVRLGDARGARADVTYGAQWELEELEDRITGDFQDRVVLDRESVAGYGELRFDPLPDLGLMAGARVERYQGLEPEWTPRGSVVWEARPGVISLRAAAGRAYKAPNLQQQYVDNPFIVANPDLAPERSTNVEAGADVRLADGRLTLSGTVFRQRFRDLIRTVGIEGTSQQTNRNIGASSARGVEWDAALMLNSSWGLESSGAWVRTEVEENQGLNPAEYPAGEPLPFRPGLVAGAGLVWSPMGGAVSARLRGNWIGAQTVLTERFSGHREELDGYLLVGATAEWRAREALRLFVRGENLLDTDYETAFDRHGIPFTVRLGAQVDLQ